MDVPFGSKDDGQKLLWAVFHDSTSAPFVAVQNFPLPGSVSIADILTEPQIHLYYRDELGPRRGDYQGFYRLSLDDIKAACDDVVSSETDLHVNNRTKIPLFTVVEDRCEVFANRDYVLFPTTSGTLFTQCCYNTTQKHCPLTDPECIARYIGFCPRNPSHHTVRDAGEPGRPAARKIRHAIAKRLITLHHLQPFPA